MKHQRKRAKEQSVEEYLNRVPDNIQSLARTLRTLVRKAVPDVLERVYPGWNIIGYRAPLGTTSAYVGFLAPFQDRIVLGFEYGVLLSDPDGVLEGRGTQVRQVTIRSAKEIRQDVLMPLLLQAVSVAKERKRLRR
jgi:hypothetical protein